MPNVVRIPVAAGAFDPSDITITDNTSGAFLIKDDSGSPTEYMRIDTTGNGVLNMKAGAYYFRDYAGTLLMRYLAPNSFRFGADSGSGTGVFQGIGDELRVECLRSGGTKIVNKMRARGAGTGDTFKIQSDTETNFEVDQDSNATFTLDETSGAVFKIVDDAASPNTYLKAVEAGSVSTERNFEIYNSTAPATSVTDGCILFCEDVSSSSELKVRDEAGNVTTLSPHNFSLIPEGASEEMAWSYYSEKNGKKINVDMLRLARLVEQISGEQIIFEEG